MTTELLLNQIKDSPNTKSAINSMADLLLIIERNRLAEQRETNIKLDNMTKILLGNGDPSHSMLNRMTNVECDLGKIKACVEKIDTLLWGEGDDISQKPLVERVKDSEKIAISAIKITWLAIGVIVAAAITGVLTLL
jgi:hypothetical protein